MNDENIRMGILTTATSKQPSKYLVGILLSVFFLTIGVLRLGQAYIDHGNSLEPPKYSKLKEITGILEKASYGSATGIAVRDAKTYARYSCRYGRCSYRDSDIGKPSRLLVHGKVIYQIEVNNMIRFSYAEKIRRTARDIRIGAIALIIGVIPIIAIFVLKILARRFK
ncbi:MAG: hypothetical protein EG822_15525 [Deltaproteobacteria bacterium]|nr:hypothetical protein [Deltaproteobacteria bacterium]TLN02596.1 MAG: hypothetical protein FDZ73_11200 [bacterium]